MNSSETSVISLKETAIQESKREKDTKEIAWECLNDIDLQIYFADRLLQGFQEQYFGTSEEVFQSSETAKTNFVYDHEYMAAQIRAISDMIFDIRLKTEFFLGDKDDPIIAAHIHNEDQMRSWLREPQTNCARK